MKHILLHEEFINEKNKSESSEYLTGHILKNTVYHVSINKIKKLKNVPTWFALEENHSDGWYANILEDRGAAYQYEARIKGN